MATRTLTFKLKGDTSGAWRFEELDANGNILPLGDAVIGTLYLRKKQTPNKNETIKVTVETE